MVKVKEFVGQVVREAKKITWSSRRETSLSVMMVFAMVLIASFFFFLVDMGMYRIIQFCLNLGVN